MKNLALLSFTFLLFSCHKKSAIPEAIAETRIVDSFLVEGICSVYELKDLFFLNDSTIVTYSHETNEVCQYQQQKPEKTFRKTKETRLSVDGLPYVFLPGSAGGYWVVDEEHVFYQFNDRLQLLSKHAFPFDMPYLGKEYVFINSPSSPFIQTENGFISRYFGPSPNDRARDLQEKTLFECRYKNDSVVAPSFYFDKPEALKSYPSQAPHWTVHDNRIDLMWSCFDTIYSYDRNTQQYSKQCLHHPRFRPLDAYDFSKGGTADYQRYALKYDLHNFEYQAFYYNEATKHYVIFYQEALPDTFRVALPKPSDKKTRILVLNEKREALCDYHYNQKYYSVYFSSPLPGKGHALARLGDPDSIGHTWFYIFNF